MDMQDQTLALIIKYGLSVRQIPETETALYSYTEGTTLAENQRLVQKFGRTMIESIKRPKLGGMWMAQRVKHSDSMVRWDVKENHLSNTLEEAVSKAVAAIEAEIE